MHSRMFVRHRPTRVTASTFGQTVFAALALVLACSPFAQAQQSKPPYQAIVENDGEYVRSGPGVKYYPTDKLRKGDKVTVHRHDPGGWCMIVPPPGSFSWIRAEHVQKTGDNRGVLKANQVVIHVGSSLNVDEFTVVQGSLSIGDAVQILGEKMFPLADGQALMYKINPVRKEWRWIQTKSIVPADAIQAEPFPGESPPRKKPSGPVADQIDLDPNAFAQPISTGETIMGPGKSNSRPQNERGTTASLNADLTSFNSRLEDVDQQFRAMIRQEPSTWDLKDIQQQYSDLENEATQPSQSKTIALRLDAVSRYEKTYGEYLSFLKVSDEARQRDARLAAIQQQHETELRTLNGGNPDGQPQPGPVANNAPQQPVPDPASATGNAGTATDAARPAAAPTFAGAGLVTSMARTFPGGPQYALIAPSGKLLAYLVPAPGVDLRRSLNQAVGVVGERGFRQEWGADAIVVRGVQPVQLRTGR